MALAKPVVVSRTAAIADGYGLENGVNVRFVPPGDATAFASAVSELLAEPEAAAALGRRARETVERELGWERYVDRMEDVLRVASR
jgi:glycosyltransferase involved in cell wall biosynthesis